MLGGKPRGQDLELFDGVYPEMGFGALDTRVAQPQRHLPDVAGGFQRMHRARVPQDVRRYPFADHRRRSPPRGFDVLRQTMSEAMPAHGEAARVEEQMLASTGCPDHQPVSKHGPGLLPQWQPPLSTTLPADEDRIRRCVEVAAQQPGGLRHAQARRVSEMQHRTIPNTGPRADVRRVEQGLDLVPVEIVDQGQIAAFRRYGMDLSGDVQARGHAVLQVAEERLDRGKPRIPGADRVAAFALQGVEEVQYQRCRQVLDHQVARPHAETVGSEAGEHLEGVGVALDRARARPPVTGQIFTEEGTQVCRQRRHVELLPSYRCSVAKATCRIKAGVASRYQYVEAMLAWPRYVLSDSMWRLTPVRLVALARSSARTAKQWRRSWRRTPPPLPDPWRNPSRTARPTNVLVTLFGLGGFPFDSTNR